jgi:hypothetical protein
MPRTRKYPMVGGLADGQMSPAQPVRKRDGVEVAPVGPLHWRFVGGGDGTYEYRFVHAPGRVAEGFFIYAEPEPVPGLEKLSRLTSKLVDNFAHALKHKLVAAQEKHGWTDDWSRDGWRAKCQSDLLAHLFKGDPLDVAAYAAFCWSHGWRTAEPTAAPQVDIPPQSPFTCGTSHVAAQAALILFENMLRPFAAELVDVRLLEKLTELINEAGLEYAAGIVRRNRKWVGDEDVPF